LLNIYSLVAKKTLFTTQRQGDPAVSRRASGARVPGESVCRAPVRAGGDFFFFFFFFQIFFLRIFSTLFLQNTHTTHRQHLANTMPKAGPQQAARAKTADEKREERRELKRRRRLAKSGGGGGGSMAI
jgi:hypothetical protein